jgi:hypothetical protein
MGSSFIGYVWGDGSDGKAEKPEASGQKPVERPFLLWLVGSGSWLFFYRSNAFEAGWKP